MGIEPETVLGSGRHWNTVREVDSMDAKLSPQKLLAAYSVGIFPMGDDEGELHWLAPDPRAVIELDRFRPSRSLRATIRRQPFDVSINRAFEQMIVACADREEGTWISTEIFEAYCDLHRLGFAHSVEAWQDDQLAGGLYGVSIGGAFFGESMFHRVTDASKVALNELIETMRRRGLELLDVQFMTPHLHSLGAVEIPRSEYERRLARAIQLPCTFVDPKDS